MNRCSANVWNAIEIATADLDDRGLRYVLFGTAALAALGVAVEVPDADILVAEDPAGDLPGEPSGEAHADKGTPSANTRVTIVIGGVRVDYVPADRVEWLRPFLDRVAVVIGGVRVLNKEDVLAIKLKVGRKKDIAVVSAVRGSEQCF